MGVGVSVGTGVSVGNGVNVSVGSAVLVEVAWGTVGLGGTVAGAGVARSVQAVVVSRMASNRGICKRIP